MDEKKIILYARNSTSSHPVLRNVIKSLSDFPEAHLFVLNLMEIKRLWTLCKGGLAVVISDDPWSYLLAKTLGFGRPQVFLSLELYEHQLPNSSARSIVRNFLFYLTHQFALKTADLVVFPSNLRAEYYRGVRRFLILPNKPLSHSPSLNDSAISKEDDAKLKRFVQRHKKTVIFAGGIHSIDLLKEFLNAVSREPSIGVVLLLSHEIKGIEQVIVGDHVLVFKKWSHRAVQEAYRICDIGLLLYGNSPLNTKYCAPVKIFEYVNADLSVVGNENYSLSQCVLVDKIYRTPEEIVPVLLSLEKKTGNEKRRYFLDDDIKMIFFPALRSLLGLR